MIKREFYLGLRFIEGWYLELDRMNRKKRGGQFKFPSSIMKWFIIWKEFLDYRGLQGIARKMSYLSLILKFPDFSTIWNTIHYSMPALMVLASRQGMCGSRGY
ncbi:MAG: hypothetical protein AMDU3_IPLC00002G0280 [Thermoplasmatales archaeon I-plasma]|nr:MAG: hypothetical protein AMDU3_IPLC00002G0280 [Thermoplasmatales archaeon I-plasma]